MEWLTRVWLDGVGQIIHELSGGMRQGSRWCGRCADPEIISLDESFSQLDHVT